MHAQGIKDPEYVTIVSKAGYNYYGFIIKDWRFATGQGISGDSEYPYLNIPGWPDVTDTEYLWKFAEVTYTSGIPGQGNIAKPAAFFNNHQLIKINGKYYDPSYGVKYNSLLELDNKAIAGFFKFEKDYPVNEPDVNLKLNSDDDTTDMGVPTDVYIIKKNSDGQDIDEL